MNVTDLWGVLATVAPPCYGSAMTVLLVVLSFAIATLLGAFVCVLRCCSQPVLRATGTGSSRCSATFLCSS